MEDMRAALIKRKLWRLSYNWVLETTCGAVRTSPVQWWAGGIQSLRKGSTLIHAIELEEKISGNH